MRHVVVPFLPVSFLVAGLDVMNMVREKTGLLFAGENNFIPWVSSLFMLHITTMKFVRFPS